jgi:antitoxin component YwqK of YwqJK toxin-antitoxin module
MKLKAILIFMIFGLKMLSQNIPKDSTVTLFLDSVKKIKIETSYFPFGKIKTEKTYCGNNMIRIIYYSKDSKPLVESNYNLNDDEFGWQKEYYENGKIKTEKFIINYTVIKEKYKNEVYAVKVFNGQFREYYENGLLKKEGYIVNGKPRGLEVLYDTNGKLISIKYYDNALKPKK